MNNNQQKKINYPGIISLILAIIPYLLFAFCYFMSNGEGEDGAGAIIWLFIIYLWSAGIPIFIASVVLGILGLFNYRWKVFSIISLILDASPMLLLISFLIFEKILS